MSVAELKVPELAPEKTSDLERLLAAGEWQVNRQWSALFSTNRTEIENHHAPDVEPFRWRFVVPDPAQFPVGTPRPAHWPDDLARLRQRYPDLGNSDHDHAPQDETAQARRDELRRELTRLSTRSGAAGWTAALLLVHRHRTQPEIWDPLFERLEASGQIPDGEKLPAATQAALREAWCWILASAPGDPEENLAVAGSLLETVDLPEEVRAELYRGIARRIPPRHIPGLGDAMQGVSQAKQATPVQRGAVEACVRHAWQCRRESSGVEYDPALWPEGVWGCRFSADPLIRKLFGRWAALADHPEALAILKAQRTDLDLSVRAAAVTSLGWLEPEMTRSELLAVMEKGTEPERAAAIPVLGLADLETVQRFVRDESPRVRAAVARVLGAHPSRASALALANLLEDRSADVQLAALEHCRAADWKETERVPLLLQALRAGYLRTQLAAVSELERCWGEVPEFPWDGTAEERDAAVRRLALEHQVSTEVYAAFGDVAVTPKPPSPQISADQLRREIRDYLHASSGNSSNLTFPASWKTLDATALPVLEQEAEHAVGPHADHLFRELLPTLHPAYAALLKLEANDPGRKRAGARELRLAAERGSLSPCVLQRLLTRMNHEQDRAVWQEVISAISPDGLPEAAQIALVGLNSTWPDLRKLSCDYFERHPQPEYAAWLLPRLQDPDREVQLRAVRLLARCGNPLALDGYPDAADAPGLRSLLTVSDQALRWEVIVAMTALGDPQAAQEIIRQSYDPSAKTREQAVEAMGQTGQSRFLEQLLRRSWTENDRGVQLALLKSLDQLAPMNDRPGLAPESSISDKIIQWGRWWEARQRTSPMPASRSNLP